MPVKHPANCLEQLRGCERLHEKWNMGSLHTLQHHDVLGVAGHEDDGQGAGLGSAGNVARNPNCSGTGLFGM